MRKGEAPVELTDLIRAVEDKTRSCTELERLEMAVKYGELLKDISDDLVGHFVDQARQAGASWGQVGERLGVTKQAAHQRHVHRTSRRFGHRSRSPGKGPFERFSQQGREIVVVAQEEARTLRHNYLGAEHLLLGLSADRSVGRILRDAGASRKAILTEVRRMVGEGTEVVGGTIPFTPRSKRALESAARKARSSGLSVEPAHLLLGILDLREGVGANILDALDVSREDLRRAAQALVSGGA